MSDEEEWSEAEIEEWAEQGRVLFQPLVDAFVFKLGERPDAWEGAAAVVTLLQALARYAITDPTPEETVAHRVVILQTVLLKSLGNLPLMIDAARRL